MFGLFGSKKNEVKWGDKDVINDSIYKSTLNYGYLVVELDEDGIIKEANDNFLDALKSNSIEMEGQPFITLMESSSKDLMTFRQQFKNAIKIRKRWQGVIRIKGFRDNIKIDLICTMVPILQNHALQKIIISCTNFTKFSNERRNFYKQYYTDSLTNFSNRQKLLDNLEYVSKQHDSTLIIFDIDDFANVNDFFGYDIGDALLKELANWLFKKRPTDNTLFYKLPVDHFAMLITEEFKREKLKIFLKNINSEIQYKLFDCLGNELNIALTIGTAQGRYDILKNANSALSHAKKNLKDSVIYDNNVNQDEEIGKNLKTIKMIKTALENDNVLPVFQPIVNAKNNKIEKYETLMRLKDESGEIISPFFFLDIGIQAKLYPKMLSQMMEKAFEYYRASDKAFSINFSVEDMLDPQIANPIIKLINKYDVGSRIVIEILESENITDYKVINEVLEKFRNFGCQIAIDDFGSGYSNFEHILKLKLDFLKIDGSLIKNIDTDKAAQLLVKTIISFAKDAHLQTIAEYVHNAVVFKKVKNLGIDYVQGYFLAAPSERLHSSI